MRAAYPELEALAAGFKRYVKPGKAEPVNYKRGTLWYVHRGFGILCGVVTLAYGMQALADVSTGLSDEFEIRGNRILGSLLIVLSAPILLIETAHFLACSQKVILLASWPTFFAHMAFCDYYIRAIIYIIFSLPAYMVSGGWIAGFLMNVLAAIYAAVRAKYGVSCHPSLNLVQVGGFTYRTAQPVYMDEWEFDPKTEEEEGFAVDQPDEAIGHAGRIVQCWTASSEECARTAKSRWLAAFVFMNEESIEADYEGNALLCQASA